jgi:hypothetical protein
MLAKRSGDDRVKFFNGIHRCANGQVGKMRFVPTDDILLKVSEGICQYFRMRWGGWLGWLVGMMMMMVVVVMM